MKRLEEERMGLGQGRENDAAMIKMIKDKLDAVRQTQVEEWESIRVEKQKLEETKITLEKIVDVPVKETSEYILLKKEMDDYNIAMNLAHQLAVEEKEILSNRIEVLETALDGVEKRLEAERKNHIEVEVNELEARKEIINQAIEKEDQIKNLNQTLIEFKQEISEKETIIEEYKTKITLASYDEELAKNSNIFEDDLNAGDELLTENLEVKELKDTVQGLREEMEKKKETDEGREAAARLRSVQVARLEEELDVIHQELEGQMKKAGILEEANRALEVEKDCFERKFNDILNSNEEVGRKASEVADSLKEEMRKLKVRNQEYEKILRRTVRQMKDETTKKRKWRKDCEDARAEIQVTKTEAESSLRQVEVVKMEAVSYKVEMEAAKARAEAYILQATEAMAETVTVKDNAAAEKVKTKAAEVRSIVAEIETEAARMEAGALKLEVEAVKVKVEAVRAEVEAVKVMAEAAKSESEASKAEAEAAKAEAETAKGEAEAAIIGAEDAKVETEGAKAEAEAAKAEADAAEAKSETFKSKAEAVREEAEVAKEEAEAVREEVETARDEVKASKAEAKAAKAEAEAAKTETETVKAETETYKAEVVKAEAKNEEHRAITASVDQQSFTMALSQEKRKGDLERVAMLKRIRMLESMVKGEVKDVFPVGEIGETDSTRLDQKFITRRCYVKVEKVKICEKINN